MTAVIQWRPPDAPPRRVHVPLPEPPRTRRVSRWAREPKDRLTRALEEWLRELAVSRTQDAD